ncbi:MAG: acylphosphatase [Alphaproteobacteria bacterium]|nr:acylphosphatase [Alphaproteobacteria bacterium]
MPDGDSQSSVTDRKTVHVRIKGRVQGVWFRAWTEKTASKLGLDGWVRNRRDGDVEAVFSGPADAVDRMLEAAKDGPPLARVSALDVRETEGAAPAGFETRPDA